MKRLLLLLFIPIISYSQISYKDVMSINSEKMFKKVMIENGYERMGLGDQDSYFWKTSKERLNNSTENKNDDGINGEAYPN